MRASLFSQPPRQAFEARACGRRWAGPDAPSFLWAYYETFVERTLRLPKPLRHGRILDIGANIGVTTVYLAEAHPDAQVIAFEPDPTGFSHLVWNLSQNRIRNVEACAAAVWTQDGTGTFSSDGADGGRLAELTEGSVQVKTLDVFPLLQDTHFDLVKLDIEGAELGVLERAGYNLRNVERICVEYHARRGCRQRLDQVLALLTSAGFRYHLRPVRVQAQPFLGLDVPYEFDLQVDIYAWRVPG